MASIGINEKTVNKDILQFARMGLHDQVLEEENLTQHEQRRIGLNAAWPSSIAERGTTKIWTKLQDEPSHFITYRKRRSADNNQDNTLISLNALNNLRSTLDMLKDEINEARHDFKEAVAKDEDKLHVFEAEITANLGGRVDKGFRDLNKENDARMENFKPAKSSTLIIIIVLQSLVIIMLIAMQYKYNKPKNAEQQ